MKKQIIMSVMVASSFMTSCSLTELDTLTERVDAVEERLDTIGGENAESLENTIQELIVKIGTLEEESTSHKGNIESVLTDLEALQLLLDSYKTEGDATDKEIQDNLNAVLAELELLKSSVAENNELIVAIEDVINGQAEVWWGNVVTADDYTALLAGNFSIVSGNVTVESAEHLTALSDVVFVGGSVQFNTVETINWNVENIGGGLYLEGQANLVNADFPQLKSVGDDFSVRENALIESVSAPMLTYIGGDFDVDGLTIVSVDEIFGEVYGSFLTTLDFNSLVGVNDDMRIYNTAVTTLSFPSLETVNDAVEFSYNKSMMTLACSSLQDVGGNLVISYNEKLETLDFDAIEMIGQDLNIEANNSGGGFGIGGGVSDPTGLQHLFTFGALKTVGQSLKINNNSELISINGFNTLETIGQFGRLEITYNGALEELNGFNGLQTAYNVIVEGMNYIAENDATFSMDAFNGVETIGQFDFRVSETVEVNNINALNGLHTVEYGINFGHENWGMPIIATDDVTINILENLDTIKFGWASVNVVMATPFSNWCTFKGLVDKKADTSSNFLGSVNLVEYDLSTWTSTHIDHSTIVDCN